MKEKPMCVCVCAGMCVCVCVRMSWCELVCAFKGEALGDGE